MMSKNPGFTAVFVREWKRIISSKICIWGIVVAPILSLVMLLWMMNAGLPTKIPIAVVDLDNSTTSRKLIRQLDAFPKTNVTFKSLSFNEARHKMEQMKVYAVLTIPRNFSKDAISGSQPKLVYYTNNAFLVSGSLLFQDLKTVSTLAAASVGLQTGTAHGYADVEIMPIVQPIKIVSHPQGNPYISYSIYLNNVILPGILHLIILMFTVSAWGSEIKAGTGRKLVALSNNSTWKMVAGKMLPYTIIYTVLALLFMSVFYYYNQFPLRSGFMPMFVNYVLLILAAQSLGIILIALFQNYRFALSIASLLGMVSFSISGFSFPALAMSGVLQALANLFPLRHFFLIYIDQALNGVEVGYSLYHYVILLVFVLVGSFFYLSLKKFVYKNEYKI